MPTSDYSVLYNIISSLPPRKTSIPQWSPFTWCLPTSLLSQADVDNRVITWKANACPFRGPASSLFPRKWYCSIALWVGRSWTYESHHAVTSRAKGQCEQFWQFLGISLTTSHWEMGAMSTGCVWVSLYPLQRQRKFEYYCVARRKSGKWTHGDLHSETPGLNVPSEAEAKRNHGVQDFLSTWGTHRNKIHSMAVW